MSSAKKVHSKIATYRQKTGGGGKLVSPKGQTKKIIDLFVEDPSFSGITGGIESDKFILYLGLGLGLGFRVRDRVRVRVRG